MYAKVFAIMSCHALLRSTSTGHTVNLGKIHQFASAYTGQMKAKLPCVSSRPKMEHVARISPLLAESCLTVLSSLILVF